MPVLLPFCCNRDFDFPGKEFDLILSKGVHDENETRLSRRNKAVTQRWQDRGCRILPRGKLLQQFSVK